VSWPKRDGSYSFLRHLGPFGCIKTTILSEIANLSKTWILENLDSTVSTDHLDQKKWVFAIFQHNKYTKECWKIAKNQSHLAKFGCGNGAILVIFSDFGLGQPKRHFFDSFFSILATKGPQMWQKSLIPWKYDGKTPLEKKLGQFRSPGAEQYFLRKKNMDRSIDLAVQHKSLPRNLFMFIHSAVASAKIYHACLRQGPTDTWYPTQNICQYPIRTRLIFKIIGYFGYRV